MRVKMISWVLIVPLGVGLLAGCAEPEFCPTSVEGATTAVVSPAGFVAIGRVARYVDADAEESRGYDLDIRRVFAGTVSSEGTFLRVSDPEPDIEQGEPVLVLAEPGAAPTVLVAGACPPLQAISEEELIRWAGSR